MLTLKSETKRQEKFSGKLKVAVQDTTSSESQQDSEIEIPVQVFYVCFSSAGDYPGSKLLRQNFTHVSIMERVPLGFLIHDPNKSALDTYILPEAPTEQFLVSFLEKRPDYTILEVTKEATLREQHLVRFGLQSCVSIVAYILGMRLPWYCITPYSLYKRINKGGDNIISIRKVTHGKR